VDLKLSAASQASGFGFGGRHARLNRADGDAGHFAIELLGQPQHRPTQSAPDIERATASGDACPLRQALHQLDLRAWRRFMAFPITMMKMFAPAETIQERKAIVMPANAVDFDRKLRRKSHFDGGLRRFSSRR